MNDHSTAMPQSLAYATPAPRSGSRLAPAVWIALVGLALVGFGGCFLIGVMAMLIPQAVFGAGAPPMSATPGVHVFISVLYLAAFGCFGGAIVLLVKGVRMLFALVSSVR